MCHGDVCDHGRRRAPPHPRSPHTTPRAALAARKTPHSPPPSTRSAPLAASRHTRPLDRSAPAVRPADGRGARRRHERRARQGAAQALPLRVRAPLERGAERAGRRALHRADGVAARHAARRRALLRSGSRRPSRLRHTARRPSRCCTSRGCRACAPSPSSTCCGYTIDDVSHKDLVS